MKFFSFKNFYYRNIMQLKTCYLVFLSVSHHSSSVRAYGYSSCSPSGPQLSVENKGNWNTTRLIVLDVL